VIELLQGGGQGLLPFPQFAIVESKCCQRVELLPTKVKCCQRIYTFVYLPHNYILVHNYIVYYCVILRLLTHNCLQFTLRG
jgi:hypothetical protein